MKFKNKYSLLVSYLFVYPLYYVVAMLIAVLILTPIMSWEFIFAKKLFLVLAFIMWFVCYIVHRDIFMGAISNIKNSK